MRPLVLTFLLLSLFACKTPVDGSDISGTSIHKNDFDVEINHDSLLYIVAVGDIMLGTSFPNTSFLPPDSLFQFEGISPYTMGADLVFGNLEGVLLDDTTALPRNSLDSKSSYRFRMPTYLAKQLKKGGFNLISTANNHSNDFQYAGRFSTVETLNKVGIRNAGIDLQPYTVFTLPSGQKVGFVAFSPNTGCNDLRRESQQIALIQKVDSLCDILIVSAHIGGEGHAFLNVNRMPEIYLGEQRGNPYVFSRKAIDAGADLFLGHGPHVPRAVDEYKNKFIVYSMGNFMTYSRVGVTSYLGYAPLFKIAINKNTGDFVSAQLISFQQRFRNSVRLDADEKALRLIQELTEKDFPESQLQFSGNLIYKN